nr:metal-dependent hydrolase [uncultured Brevundimonas sp.]
MSVQGAPADLRIRPRDFRIDRTASSPRLWVGGDPAGTAVMNALSLTFPDGERFFIRSVRRFEKEAPAALRGSIRDFIVQEGAHTREHMAFNAQVEASGYDIAGPMALIDAHMARANGREPLAQLAITVALEHFTAAFAHVLLAHPQVLAGSSPHLARLWRWHAIEEIEHKAVAYDLLMHRLAGVSRLRRWTIRWRTMALVTLSFLSTVTNASLLLMRQDGITGLAARWRLFRWLWLKPGLYRLVASDYLSFYRPGFHPWQKDDRDLIAEAEFSLAQA